MSYLDQEYYEFADFQKEMEEATIKLRRLNIMQKAMRWQFDQPNFYEQFVSEMNEAEGWISSHC
jgi:hypothetical protein